MSDKIKIAIAGIGGIGSNVAANLVRAGVCHLLLVDYDRVEATNLNRQFYFHDQIGHLKTDALATNLRRIRPNLRLELCNIRLTKKNIQEIFTAWPIVVEGLDGQADKKTLLEACTEKTLVVSACGIAGVHLAGIRVQSLGNCRIVGDFTSDCRDLPVYSHKVQAVAAYMTEIILAATCE